MAALTRCLGPATIVNGAGVLDVGFVLVVPFGNLAVCLADPGGNEKEPAENAFDKGQSEKGKKIRPRKTRRITCSSCPCSTPCRPHPYVAVGQENMERINPRVVWSMGHGASGEQHQHTPDHQMGVMMI